MQIIKEKGSVLSEEFQLRNKDGSIHIVLFSADLITVEGDDCLLAMTVDITGHKKVQESIKESEMKYR